MYEYTVALGSMIVRPQLNVRSISNVPKQDTYSSVAHCLHANRPLHHHELCATISAN
jgi:hypothetical protein